MAVCAVVVVLDNIAAIANAVRETWLVLLLLLLLLLLLVLLYSKRGVLKTGVVWNVSALWVSGGVVVTLVTWGIHHRLVYIQSYR